MKTTVIHHSADFDGIFCREIARHFIPDAEFIGWDFGDKPLPVPTEGTVYVMDLPVDRVFGCEFVDHSPECLDPEGSSYPLVRALDDSRIVWIDHHKSSIESHPESIPGYRIDGVAACRLAWQWFTIVDGNTAFGNAGNSIRAAGVLPMIQDYKAREVNEPFAVRLAGEYDIWDKRDERAELFQHGLRSQDLSEKDWSELLDEKATIGFAHRVQVLLMQGRAVQYAMSRQNESVIKKNGFTVQWEGLTFLACNHGLYNSHLFTAGIRPEHDALLGFCMRSNGQWTVSLYGVTGKPDIDLSTIAIKHGGGGHKQACGFTCDKLPFLP